MRRVVHPDSSNVALPVLPEAKMDMRNEIRIPQCWRANASSKFSAAMDHGKLRSPRQSLEFSCADSVQITRCSCVSLNPLRLPTTEAAMRPG